MDRAALVSAALILLMACGGSESASFDELVTLEALQGHLEQFEQVALANDNNRAAGTPGFNASFNYVKAQLAAVGLSFTTPSFDYMLRDSEGQITPAQSNNIVAEIAGEAADEIIMFGAHLDSVTYGPGINDNGSGCAALLEIAKQLHAYQPARTVRLAWWSAEEPWVQGSGAYATELSTTDISRILGYINLDMVGTPNHVYRLSDGDGSVSGSPHPGMSAEIESFFRQDFEDAGEPLLDWPVNDRSDYRRFAQAGIGFADLNSGYEEIKTAEEAKLFGGTAGEPYDSCYHQPCDDLSNIDMDVLMTITKSVARALQYFGIEGQGLGSP